MEELEWIKTKAFSTLCLGLASASKLGKLPFTFIEFPS